MELRSQQKNYTTGQQPKNLFPTGGMTLRGTSMWPVSHLLHSQLATRWFQQSLTLNSDSPGQFLHEREIKQNTFGRKKNVALQGGLAVLFVQYLPKPTNVHTSFLYLAYRAPQSLWDKQYGRCQRQSWQLQHQEALRLASSQCRSLSNPLIHWHPVVTENARSCDLKSTWAYYYLL